MPFLGNYIQALHLFQHFLNNLLPQDLESY
ncbi:MAG: tetratricopeptide repeat protein [Campylobacter jejuni]|nr:tetratricopeptide repeat protein [Campylobacter jejuni]